MQWWCTLYACNITYIRVCVYKCQTGLGLNNKLSTEDYFLFHNIASTVFYSCLRVCSYHLPQEVCLTSSKQSGLSNNRTSAMRVALILPTCWPSTLLSPPAPIWSYPCLLFGTLQRSPPSLTIISGPPVDEPVLERERNTPPVLRHFPGGDRDQRRRCTGGIWNCECCKEKERILWD